MAKKSEILNEIHGVINESIVGVSAAEKNFGLKRVINECMGNGRPEILNVLQRVDDALNEGVDEILLIRPMLEGLTKYEPLFDVIKKNCDYLRKTINENLDDINLAELYESIENDAIKNYLGVVFESYVNSKTLENKASLVALLESVVGFDENAAKLKAYVKDNIIPQGVNNINPYAESVSEAEVIDYKGQKFVQDANGQLHAINATTMEQIYENVDNYIEQRIAESKAEKEAIEEAKDYRNYDAEIRLVEHVRSLQKAFPNNERLQNVLAEYASALQAGCREEMLYETFCQKMSEGFDYLVPVERAVEAINEAVKDKKPFIGLVKILETMSNTNWSSWVPIIEGVVVDYMENPNPQTRSILLNHLRMYESCPYVVDIMLCVNAQAQQGNENALAETLSVTDRNKFIGEHAHTETVFSPVQYVKENECIFNVENIYYVRKGSNITKLSKDAIGNLSESFMALSILVNDPHVVINENDDCIEYYTSDNMIEIHESVAKIGEKFYTLDELKDVNEMAMAQPNMTDVNFLTAAFLMENFNNIGKIDFVTKISMNENENKTLDLFRIKDNIFVSSHDNVNEEHIFYRNVKPLQLKNIINEHFGMNVSNLFEDLMPNQDKIVNELNELRNSYENKINSLLEMKQKMEDVLETLDESESENIKKSLKEINAQINEAKKNYKKFQKKADEIENGKDCDNDAPVLNEEEPKKKPKKAKKVNEEDDDFDFGTDGDENGADDLGDLDFGGDEDLSFLDDGSEDDEDTDFDLDGSEYDFEDGSEYNEDDEYTTSDGDDMTASIEDGGASFETDPFAEDGSDEDIDFSLNGAQDDENYADFGDGEGEDEDFDMGDLDNEFGGEEGLTAEEDPFGEQTAELEGGIEGEVEDAVTGEPEQRTDDTADDADLDYANFKIVKVDFDVNVRTGEQKSTGKAIVVVPWIDDFGNKTSETKTIPFYISDIQGEKGVVLDTAGMSVEMYNAVTSAIKNSEAFGSLEAQSGEGEGATELGAETDTAVAEPTDTDNFASDELGLGADDDEFDPMGDDNFSDPFDSGSDETTVITMDDGIEPHGINTPTYKSGETEIDLPANNAPMTDGAIIDIVGESKKVGRGKKALNETKVSADPFDSLFENLTSAAAETIEKPQGEEGSSERIVTAEEQEDPIAVIEDVLLNFEESLTEDEGDVDVEVGEIEDFDIDGTDVSSIKAVIGENEYAFFSLDGKVYSCLAEDFDANSEDIDTLYDFVESDDDNLSECEGADTEAVVALVTDIISIETGEDFTYDIEGDAAEEVEEEIDENPEYREERDLSNENF